MSDFVYMGTSVRRVEDPRFLTGAGTFIDDVRVPGVAHASILRSNRAHARIGAIDTETARTAPDCIRWKATSEFQQCVDSGRVNTGGDDIRQPSQIGRNVESVIVRGPEKMHRSGARDVYVDVPDSQEEFHRGIWSRGAGMPVGPRVFCPG